MAGATAGRQAIDKMVERRSGRGGQRGASQSMGVATAEEMAGTVELYAIGQDGRSMMSLPRIVLARADIPTAE